MWSLESALVIRSTIEKQKQREKLGASAICKLPQMSNVYSCLQLQATGGLVPTSNCAGTFKCER